MEMSRAEIVRLWHRVQDSKRIGENWSLYEHSEDDGFAVWTDRMHEYKEGRQILTLRDLLKVARKDYRQIKKLGYA